MSHEVNKIFNSVDVAHRRANGNVKNQLAKLQQAGLSQQDISRSTDLLLKLSCIDAARHALAEENQQIRADLDAARKATRSAEFGRARAEALAVVRGESLSEAQRNALDAEKQQVALGEMLRSTLAQLGVVEAAAQQTRPTHLRPYSHTKLAQQQQHNDHATVHMDSPAPSGFTVHTNQLSSVSESEEREDFNTNDWTHSNSGYEEAQYEDDYSARGRAARVEWRDINQAAVAANYNNSLVHMGTSSVDASAFASIKNNNNVQRLPAGTFLSPTVSTMMMRQHYDDMAGAATYGGRAAPAAAYPSPQSHIKAINRNTNNLQFYLPFSAGILETANPPRTTAGGGQSADNNNTAAAAAAHIDKENTATNHNYSLSSKMRPPRPTRLNISVKSSSTGILGPGNGDGNLHYPKKSFTDLGKLSIRGSGNNNNNRMQQEQPRSAASKLMDRIQHNLSKNLAEEERLEEMKRWEVEDSIQIF